MKIFELFEERENIDWELLLEDLGTLEVVSPKFKQYIRTHITYKRLNSFGTKTQYSQELKNQLPPYLGKNAQVDTFEIKNANNVMNAIKGEDVRNVILSIDGRQFLMFMRVNGPYKSTGSSDEFYTIIDTEDFFASKEDRVEKIKELQQLLSPLVSDKDLVQVPVSKLAKVVNAFLAIKKEIYPKSKLELIEIKSDIKRAEQHKEREINRQIPLEVRHLVDPIIPMKTKQDIDLWKKNLKSYLNLRLETFKEHKASEATSPEEFLDIIKKEGFLDKIKINGIIYEMSGSTIKFDNLVAQSRGNELKYDWDRSSITYRADYRSQPFRDYVMALSKYEDSLKDIVDRGSQKFEDMMNRYRIAETIEIYLTMKGSSIVVDKIDIEKFNDWRKLIKGKRTNESA